MSELPEKIIDRIASVWLEEYKALASDIGKRIELQQKNLSLNLVFMSAIAGYLFKYGLDNGFLNIVNSEICILLSIAPIVSQVFSWRHIDHDLNIIDKASYIQGVIRPNLNRLLGHKGLLGFEKYLSRTRGRRLKAVGLFSLLGNDHVISISYAIIYLTFGWAIVLNCSSYSGKLQTTFFWLLITDSTFMMITIYMVTKTILRYRSICRDVCD